jgi:hypothetical protein
LMRPTHRRSDVLHLDDENPPPKRRPNGMTRAR